MRMINNDQDLVMIVKDAIRNGYAPTLDINGESYEFSTNFLTDDYSPIKDGVIYKGKEYPVYHVFVPEFGVRLVSSESLNEVLDFSDPEAQAIDEEIFFYAPDEYIDDSDLGRLVWSWLR